MTEIEEQPAGVRIISFEGERLSARERVQGLNDGLAGFMVLLAGYSSLTGASPLSPPLAWLNILVGGAAVATTVWEVRTARHLGGRVPIVAFGSALLLLLDGFEQAIQGHRPGFANMAAAGLFYMAARIQQKQGRKRRITLAPDSVSVRFNRLRNFTLPTADIEWLRISPRAIEIHAGGRTRRIRRSMLPDWDTAVAAFEAWAADNGVAVAP